jgi:hypothetical protein
MDCKFLFLFHPKSPASLTHLHQHFKHWYEFVLTRPVFRYFFRRAYVGRQKYITEIPDICERQKILSQYDISVDIKSVRSHRNGTNR